MNPLMWLWFVPMLGGLDEVPRTLQIHALAERDSVSAAASLAYGELKNHRAPKKAWPVKVLSIGHTMASYQDYGGDPYFHHGLDIRADSGTPVYAASGGKVVNIENYMGGSAYWEVAILDPEGFLWQYHHVDHDSIPKEIFDAYKSGTEISDGTKIGEVFYWPIVAMGERYHHIHLNILGKNKEYLNPFAFLEPLPDSQVPSFGPIGVLKDGRLEEGPVTGKYTLYAELRDLIMHDKFIVPPNEISISIDQEMPLVVWRFDSLPGGSSNTQFVKDFYVPSMVCGNYSCRKPVINLGFSTHGTRAFPSTPGQHSMDIRIKDFNGNQDQTTFTWTVQ